MSGVSDKPGRREAWGRGADVVTRGGEAAPSGLDDLSPNPPAAPCPEGCPEYLARGGRDLRLDMMRGYFVFAMVVDHLAGMSPVYLVTGGNRFFTSAAEGFIFTSGLVTGLVYKKLIERDGLSPSSRKVLSRSFTLYLLTIGLTLLFLPFSEALVLPWEQGVDLSDPLGFVVSVLTLHRTYYLVDVMLLYTVLFLAAPMALIALARGKTRYLLAAVWLLWLLHQFFPDYASLPWPISGNYLFHLSAWQALFFTGMVLGYHKERFRLPSRRVVWLLWGVALVGFGLLILLYFYLDPPTGAAVGGGLSQETRLRLLDLFFAKTDARPGRLVASAIVFGFMFLSLTLFWRPLHRSLGWLLMRLGQRSLYAYAAHVILAGLTGAAAVVLALPSSGSPWLNAGIQLGSVLLIWLLVRFHVLSPTPRTRRAWNLSPVAFALACLLVLPRVPAFAEQAQLAAARPPAGSAAAEAAAGGNIVVPRINRLGSPVPAPTLTPGGPRVNALGSPIAAPTLTPAPRANPLGSPIAPNAAAAGAAAGAPAASQAARTPGPPGNTPAAGVSGSRARPAPQPAVTPYTIPTPQQRSAIMEDGGLRESPYVGDIQGTVHERYFYSQALNADMPYYIYLPPDYGTADRRYPVLYMLHGIYGHSDEWLADGLIDAADQEIYFGSIRPMIIVLPQGDESYFTNHTGDGPKWGDYIWRDLVRHIDNSYRTLRMPSSRAIGGLSMGAWGALSLAFNHPNVFGVVGAHTPTLHADDGSLAFLGTGDEWNKKDPLALALTIPADIKLRIWLDAGQEDPWLDRIALLDQALAGRDIPHEWHTFPGAHDSAYWSGHVLDYLRWYASVLTAQ